MEFETDNLQNLQSSASNCIRVSGHTPMHCLPQRVKKRMSKQENQQSPLKQLTNLINPPPKRVELFSEKEFRDCKQCQRKAIGGVMGFAVGILNLLDTPGLLTSADHGSRSCPSLHLLCQTTSAAAFYCGCKNFTETLEITEQHKQTNTSSATGALTTPG